MKEMLIGASWPPRPPPTRVCVPATDAYFGQAALEVLELKHTLGVYVVWLTSSQLILVLLWM